MFTKCPSAPRGRGRTALEVLAWGKSAGCLVSCLLACSLARSLCLRVHGGRPALCMRSMGMMQGHAVLEIEVKATISCSGGGGRGEGDARVRRGTRDKVEMLAELAPNSWPSCQLQNKRRNCCPRRRGLLRGCSCIPREDLGLHVP